MNEQINCYPCRQFAICGLITFNTLQASRINCNILFPQFHGGILLDVNFGMGCFHHASESNPRITDFFWDAMDEIYLLLNLWMALPSVRISEPNQAKL